MDTQKPTDAELESSMSTGKPNVVHEARDYFDQGRKRILGFWGGGHRHNRERELECEAALRQWRAAWDFFQLGERERAQSELRRIRADSDVEDFLWSTLLAFEKLTADHDKPVTMPRHPLSLAPDQAMTAEPARISRPRTGVSLYDAALILQDNDPRSAADMKRKWQKSRAKKPSWLGTAPEHSQTYLATPEDVARYAAEVERNMTIDVPGLIKQLRPLARTPKPFAKPPATADKK